MLTRHLPLALAALLVGAACIGRTAPPPGADGPLIYELQNCANCHGGDRGGKSLGPPLLELAEHWTREDLVAFLADPDGFVQRDSRLQVLEARYSGTMTPYAHLTPEQRTVLADWLLASPR